jgi:hypothetical protein
MIRAARSAGGAALIFFVASAAVTWPLARGLTRDVPSDYGDPLYAAWAIAWVSHQAQRAVTGHPEALLQFWDANQLHPEPTTLALSDHFVAQALPVAPLYWVTGNPILALNAAYLIAFTLSGLGAYLLVRELTGSAAAGYLAGLVLAFNPFTLVFEVAHLQVISIGWMPLTIFALRRYFVTGSRRPLAGAVACLVLSNLSSGYYLLMFAPFVALYAVWEVVGRRLWTAPSRLCELAVAALAVAAVTAPFVWPYVIVQQRYGFARTTGETSAMAATVAGYAGSIRQLGIAYAFAAVAMVTGIFHVVRGLPQVRRYPMTGFVTVAAALAFWLSLGPAPVWGGEAHPWAGLYGVLQQHVPGMSSIRVSSRFAAIFLVFAAVLAGMGAARVAAARVGAPAAVLGLGAGLLLMNLPGSFRLNAPLASTDANLRPPPAYLTPSPSAPEVYRRVAKLEGRVVVAEFPFTDLWYSTRYLFFSSFHWKPIVNGFTSFLPPPFLERQRWLINPHARRGVAPDHDGRDDARDCAHRRVGRGDGATDGGILRVTGRPANGRVRRSRVDRVGSLSIAAASHAPGSGPGRNGRFGLMISLPPNRSMPGLVLGVAVGLPMAAVAVHLGWRTHHYPFLNDFWPLLFQAATFDWSDLDSFKNGFFPPGYGLFLAAVGGRHVLANAYYANLIFGLCAVIGAAWATHRLAGPLGAAIAAGLTAYYPLSFSLVMTTGPDAGCAAMLGGGAALLHVSYLSEAPRARSLASWGAAFLFAIASLWRYHALIFSVAALAATASVTRGRVNWRAAAGVVGAFGVLGLLSLLPGLSPQLARAQAFGVWEAMHPVNWYHMPTDFPPTVGGVIREQPNLFWHAYWQFHRPYLWIVFPPLLAAVLLRGAAQRVAFSVLLLELAYLPVVGVGTSLRGFAPVIPLTMVCVGLLVGWCAQRLQSIAPPAASAAAAIALITLAVGRPWFEANRAFVAGSIAGFEWRRAVETELRAQGVTAPLQVFGDAGFHFVLNHGPGWYSYLARSNGGWPRLDLYRLSEIAPELQTSSLEAFVEDCERSGITHVVLGATSGGLSPEIGELYAGHRAHPRLHQTAAVAGFKVFKLGS